MATLAIALEQLQLLVMLHGSRCYGAGSMVNTFERAVCAHTSPPARPNGTRTR